MDKPALWEYEQNMRADGAPLLGYTIWAHDDDRDEDSPVAEAFAEDHARLIAAAPETAAERDRLREINAELLAALKLIRAGAQIGRMRTYDLMEIVDPAITRAEAGK